MSKGWDSVMLKKLKGLMGKGLSTSEIGKRLGMSKNAVVGKLNRLGWNSKAGGVVAESATSTTKKTASGRGTKKTSSVASAKNTRATSKKSTTKAGARGAVATGTKKTTSGGRTLNKTLAMHQRIIQHSLEMANLKPNQCRWPIGDPDSENFHFCGAPVFVGKPYCYEHCKQAYQFTPPRKK